MNNLLFNLPLPPVADIINSDKKFPIHRIFCIGRNYEAHAIEMGNAVEREEPFYFTKLVNYIVLANNEKATQIPMAMATQQYHYEMELVVCLDKGGANIPISRALDCIYGYACGLDMTRRDLQNKAKEKGKPWDYAKSFEHSAILGSITPKTMVNTIENQTISLTLNGKMKQQSSLNMMIWNISEIIEYLSKFHILQAGDIIYTGTPAGVGAVTSGDVLCGKITGLQDILVQIN